MKTKLELDRAASMALAIVAVGGKPRVLRDVAQYMLLNSPLTRNGVMYDISARSVGAGVWEISGKW